MGGDVELAVIGGGHVGLVSAACLAELGHRVRVQDVDRGRVERLSAGELPFREPGLAELTMRGLRMGRLSFHAEPNLSVRWDEAVYMCVHMPNGNWHVDATMLLVAGSPSARLRP